MLTLQDLDAVFCTRTSEMTSNEDPDITLARADGIRFLCPKCWFDDPVGAIGCHSIVCWFVGRVPNDATPGPGRWVPSGTGISDLTFVGPSSASVALTGGCGAHFHIRNGAIVGLP